MSEYWPDVANVDSVRGQIECVNVGAEESRQIAFVAPSLAEVLKIDGDDLLRRFVVEKAKESDALRNENRTQASRRGREIGRPAETIC